MPAKQWEIIETVKVPHICELTVTIQ